MRRINLKEGTPEITPTILVKIVENAARLKITIDEICFWQTKSSGFHRDRWQMRSGGHLRINAGKHT